MNVLDHIQSLTDKVAVVGIIKAAQTRLEELERDKGELYLTLHKGEWYATTAPEDSGREWRIRRCVPADTSPVKHVRSLGKSPLRRPQHGRTV